MATTFYATNNFIGDGTTVNWNINFADGYIDTTHVKARYLDNTGSYVDIAISSVAGNVVTISPAVANGQEFQIYRDTEKRFPLVDFSDGAILNETNLDTLATQAVMVSAEAFDQSNNGVRIAGDSLVVAQGIDAKAQLALDNSDAAVATANAIDGKAQTALDSSAAAVATANTAASTAAGAVVTANIALATANDAADDAAIAVTTANGAVTTANAATTTANAASAAAAAATTTANNAANDAANAVSTAGTALSTANTASTNASTAVTTANDAKTTAEGIEAKADSALAASATAVSTANSAEATANAIDGKATDALNTADSAEATANAASATATSAAADASTALSTVTAADTKAQTALDNTTALDAATMKKAANLSDIADKAAAWLNVRPIGSTPLAGDPVGDYDAATKRWVENLINAGTVGPTMNGVMNFGVGQSIPWDSRAYIPPYALPKDGQIVNRSDWPELWAHAQQHGAVDDSDWIADVAKRGSYSKGDGTTTFRLPDWNGVQKNGVNGFTGADSIPANFFRGGGSAADMTIKQNAAPNIVGQTGLVLVSRTTSSTGSLFDNWSNYWSSAAPGGTSSDVYRENAIGIDASRYSSSYGRNDTTEVYPNHVSGVWLVRASGGFVAANTQWSVLNGDATLPPNSTVVRGGAVKSGYTVGGSLRKEVSLTSYETIGGSTSQSGAEILTGSASYKFTDAGIAQATSWNSTSDPRVKSLIEVIPDPLDLMRGIRGYSWYYEHTASKGFGFLSSEVGVNFSGAVSTFGDAELPDGTVIHDVEGVDTVGVSAALHHEAILALMDKVEALEAQIAALTAP